MEAARNKVGKRRIRRKEDEETRGEGGEEEGEVEQEEDEKSEEDEVMRAHLFGQQRNNGKTSR